VLGLGSGLDLEYSLCSERHLYYAYARRRRQNKVSHSTMKYTSKGTVARSNLFSEILFLTHMLAWC